jgi:hypothetical protein
MAAVGTCEVKEIKTYEVSEASNVITSVPNVMKIGRFFQKLKEDRQTETERHRERQTDRETHRERERETERETRTHARTHTQHGNHISKLYFLKKGK